MQKGGQQYLPKADDISDNPEDADNVRQLRRIMPIPTHWVPIFMDGPSMDVAIGRLTILVKQAKQEELDDYAPFIYNGIVYQRRGHQREYHGHRSNKAGLQDPSQSNSGETVEPH